MKVKANQIIKYESGTKESRADLLAVEEPLEIRLTFKEGSKFVERALSVTMRTPGSDKELALGFLFTENIISSVEDVISVEYCVNVPVESEENVIKVALSEKIELDWNQFQRNFYTNSSCGVCGKSALESISCFVAKSNKERRKLNLDLNSINERVFESQGTFKHTGGIHAAALLDFNGKLIDVREDIGRHNAVDKIIGSALLNKIDLRDKILWLSGRSGFELIQKAIVAGIDMVISVGAPSSLAVELAQDHDLILLGFNRNNSFNIYSGSTRLGFE